MSENNQNRADSRRQSSSQERRAPQDRKKSRRRHRRPLILTIFLRFFQVLGTLLLIGAVTASFVACYAAVYIKTAVMPEATLDLTAYTLSENSVIYYYDDDGNPVEWVTLMGTENREWVDYEDIPQDLVDAFVAIEDTRFWQHQGVDWKRTAGAFLNMFLSMRDTFGGSTITQQLIKNMTEYDDATVKRKITEIFTALDVENRYQKEEILEHYLNWIFFGNGCYGVQAAAEFYFDKDVRELTLAECASLAGITNNPSMYSPNALLSVPHYRCKTCQANGLNIYSLDSEEACERCGGMNYGPEEIWSGREYNKYRQTVILGQMVKEDCEYPGPYITQAEYDAAVSEPLVFSWDKEDTGEEDEDKDEVIYPWYVDAVISEVITDLMESTGMNKEVVTNMVYSGGLKIYVPYDPDIQAKVDQIYNDRANLDYTSKTGQQMSSAITVIDNSTGYVVAMAGDVGAKEVNRGWNNAMSKQQPGSSIKPLSVYSPALEYNLITPGTVYDDNPLLLENGEGEEDDAAWPVNAPLGWRGLTTIQDAVVRSVNTVAVRVLMDLTPEASFQFMEERYGFDLLDGRWEGDQYVSDIDRAPLAMGGLSDGVSTFDMAAAYATFPRNGGYTEPTTYLRIEDVDGNLILDNVPDTKYVIKESTAYYINSMLTEAVRIGTGTGAKIEGQVVAGKTGTTQNMFDLYFAGYTDYYTAAVWTGYPYDEYMDIKGNPSVTLWQKVMALVHEGMEAAPFEIPDEEKEYTVCIDCGKLATSACEIDLRGNRTKTFTMLRGDGPTEYCDCHVTLQVCTECPIFDANGKETGAYLKASAYCPAESVKEVSMVQYTRELAKPDVVVKDYYALMSIYDGLETDTCNIHTWDPWLPGWGDDDGDDDGGGWWGDIDWPWGDEGDDPDPVPTPGIDIPPEGGEDPGPGNDPGIGEDPGTDVPPDGGEDPGTDVPPDGGEEPGTGDDPGPGAAP